MHEKIKENWLFLRLIDICKEFALKNSSFKNLLDKFFYIKLDDIPLIIKPKIKVRNINPLVNGSRYNKKVSI